MTFDVLREVLALAFGAGGAYFFLKQARKDVNGLGYKVNAEVKQSARRHINVVLSLMVLAPDEVTKRKIADLLKEGGE
jgi:hypothetical protein